jgi:hypothetical protein
VVDRLDELCGRYSSLCVAYDAAGPALDLADAARRRGLTLEGIGAKEYAAACAGLLSGLSAGSLRYRRHEALDIAAASAARRTLGDAWAFGRRQSSGSIAAITAATVALWGYDHAPASVGTFRIF